jgi:hypothetical protein
MKVSFLVLDYNKPEETLICLESIKKRANIDKEVVLLSNGGNQDHVLQYYKNGLIDRLILNRENSGCGNGTVQLFESCQTEYAFYVQNDQFLGYPLVQSLIDNFIDVLEFDPTIFCIDVAGQQAGHNVYSERAHFIKVSRYLKVDKGIPGQLGGPGPFNFNRYTEQYVQEHCKINNLSVVHTTPLFFDNGKWSIREIGDGVYKHRCDTKEFYVIKQPTYKTEAYPPFNEDEWQLALNGKWINGTIPEQWKTHSFKVWQ